MSHRCRPALAWYVSVVSVFFLHTWVARVARPSCGGLIFLSVNVSFSPRAVLGPAVPVTVLQFLPVLLYDPRPRLLLLLGAAFFDLPANRYGLALTSHFVQTSPARHRWPWLLVRPETGIGCTSATARPAARCVLPLVSLSRRRRRHWYRPAATPSLVVALAGIWTSS